MPTTYTHHNQQQPLGTIVYMEDILEDVRVDGTPNMVDNDKERIMSNNSMERQEDQLRGQEMGENEHVPRKKFKTEVDSTLEEK
ncbi:hypothetical protein Ddc_09498 [Ditylenchus destructor]|nr:hypothetical protein Ddc_09498 [Ditylenchus destructor]